MLLFVVSVNIVSRSLYYVDTYNYTQVFLDMSNLGLFEALNQYSVHGEPAFLTLQWLTGSISDSPRFFLFIAWMLFIIPFIGYLKRLFNPWQLSVVFFTYLNFAFFYGYTTNVLKQGISIAFILLAVSDYVNMRVGVKRFIPLVIGSLFHWSCLPFSLVLLALMKFNMRLKSIMIIWLVTATLFIAQLNESITSPLKQFIPKIDGYTSGATLATYLFKTNRIDFFLFSLFWLVLSLILYYFLYRDDAYQRIIKVYALFNSLFLLLGFVAFSDRIASYSWFLIPLLIWYPVFKTKKYKSLWGYALLLTVLAIGFYTGEINKYTMFYKIE